MKHTTNTIREHTSPQCNSNPRSQQSSSHRRTH